MKIVVNRCYGGFGLSTAAVKELVHRESKTIVIRDVYEYAGGAEPFRYGAPVDVGDGFVTSGFGSTLHKDDKVYYFVGDRDDPDLIALIEDLGSEVCSGECAKLEVVEIPDGTDWEIEEYDGREWVSEKHCTW